MVFVHDVDIFHDYKLYFGFDGHLRSHIGLRAFRTSSLRMDCNQKRSIVQARAERLLQYAFVITGKDFLAKHGPQVTRGGANFENHRNCRRIG